MSMDEITKDIGDDLHTESLLLRAKQLARLESDKLVDKMTALERGKKIDELQKRLLDSEMLRNRCTRKVTLLKDQVRTTSETAEQERSMCENSIQLLRDDLTNTKASLADCHRRENQVFL
ncbi:uncharacterized protein LOC142321277 [Lycorma delicatula]|uniref:uncharacterized protein LOC142321277 n=1 Tax=Lycorma delicatula TaxID=130591 RepID=UPI003F517D7E